MIPRAFITEWRAQAPWSLDSQVEQDLIITRSLVSLFNSPALDAAVAFRGGTALHKLYLAPAARYSEDIDLVLTNPDLRDRLPSLIQQALEWLGPAEMKENNGGVMLVFPFTTEIEPTTRMKLKIEATYGEPFSIQ